MSEQPSICIDAGHGGKDPGAVGLRGRREKDVCLAVAGRLAVILQNAGLRVVQTRMDDRFLELHERAAIANREEVDLFLSLHCNSAENRSASGFEVFTTPGRTAADAFATALFYEFGERFPTKAKRMDTSDGDEDKEANFAVIRLAKMPAALFELDFISNPEAELWLADEANQAAMAEALADGVLRHLGLASGPSKPAKAGAPSSAPARLTAPERFLAAVGVADLPGYLRELDAAALRELLTHCEAISETGRIWTGTALEVLRRFQAGNL